MLVLFGWFFTFGLKQIIPGDEVAESPRLEVSDVAPRMNGAHLYVLGAVRNVTTRDAARIWFRVSIRDNAGKLIDTLLLEDRGLVVPAGKTVPFRVDSMPSIDSLDGAKVEVSVERARPANRWD